MEEKSKEEIELELKKEERLKKLKSILVGKEELLNRYENLLSLFDNKDRKESFDKLVEFAENQTEYLISPASAKYHLCIKNGLLEHSVNVTEHLLRLRKTLAPEIPISSCILVGLFHDLGKVGMPGRPFYIKNYPTDKQAQYGYPATTPYGYSDKLVTMTHADRSAFLIMSNMRLNELEYQAVRYHDGQYCDENKPVAQHEEKLLFLLNVADYWSARFVETNERDDIPVKNDSDYKRNEVK